MEKNHYFFKITVILLNLSGRIRDDFKIAQKLPKILYHTCFLSDVYLFCLAICHMLFSTRVIISAGLCCCLLLLVILLFYLMYLY